jgi:hypothetical protein
LQDTTEASMESWLADLMQIIVRFIQPDDEGRIGTVLQMRKCLKAIQVFNDSNDHVLDDKPWVEIFKGSFYSMDLLSWIETARSQQTFEEWAIESGCIEKVECQQLTKNPLSMMKSLLLTTLISRGGTVQDHCTVE